MSVMMFSGCMDVEFCFDADHCDLGGESLEGTRCKNRISQMD